MLYETANQLSNQSNHLDRISYHVSHMHSAPHQGNGASRVVHSQEVGGTQRRRQRLVGQHVPRLQPGQGQERLVFTLSWCVPILKACL